jgi:hypothetical protein
MHEFPTHICRAIFRTRYEEHIQGIINNDSNSGYSNHVLTTGHSVTDLMSIEKTEKKENISTHYKMPQYVKSVEIYTYDPVFETLQELNTK